MWRKRLLKKIGQPVMGFCKACFSIKFFFIFQNRNPQFYHIIGLILKNDRFNTKPCQFLGNKATAVAFFYSTGSQAVLPPGSFPAALNSNALYAGIGFPAEAHTFLLALLADDLKSAAIL